MGWFCLPGVSGIIQPIEPRLTGGRLPSQLKSFHDGMIFEILSDEFQNSGGTPLLRFNIRTWRNKKNGESSPGRGIPNAAASRYHHLPELEAMVDIATYSSRFPSVSDTFVFRPEAFVMFDVLLRFTNRLYQMIMRTMVKSFRIAVTIESTKANS